MKRTLLPLLVVLAAVVPARAATQNVTIRNNFFDPIRLTAQAGNQITWSWLAGSNPHSVTAYSGAAFDSGVRSTGTFSIPYSGGTVRYYCTVHGLLGAGNCSGMCGEITDDSIAPPPPVISQPANGAAIEANPVSIAGTASGDSVTVRLREAGTVLTDAAVSGGAWSASRSFTNGSHTVSATAFDEAGNESTAVAVSFTVGDRTPPPAPVIAQPADGAGIPSSPVNVAGTASSDSTSVRLKDAGVTIATLVVSAGAWGDAIPFPDGDHRIVATALDESGNESAASIPVGFQVDTHPPVPVIGSPADLTVQQSPFSMTGTATDNLHVEAVVVRARNVLTATVLETPAVCTGCGTPNATWGSQLSLPTGIYRVQAIGTDRVGNAGSSGEITLVVI